MIKFKFIMAGLSTMFLLLATLMTIVNFHWIFIPMDLTLAFICYWSIKYFIQACDQRQEERDRDAHYAQLYQEMQEKCALDRDPEFMYEE